MAKGDKKVAKDDDAKHEVSDAINDALGLKGDRAIDWSKLGKEDLRKWVACLEAPEDLIRRLMVQEAKSRAEARAEEIGGIVASAADGFFKDRPIIGKFMGHVLKGAMKEAGTE